MIRKVGQIINTPIYETPYLGSGYDSAGLCLPGIGIFIGKNTYHCDPELILHEYGHVLQYKLIGFINFYLKIGLRSLRSAQTNGYGKGHQLYWTEQWANRLAKNYFSHYKWNNNRFPTGNTSITTTAINQLKNPFYWSKINV